MLTKEFVGSFRWKHSEIADFVISCQWPSNSTQQFSAGSTIDPSDTSLTTRSQPSPNAFSQARKNSLDQETPGVQYYGKRRAEELLHERHGKIEAAGKSKVLHV
jgi:hypothetical protein